MSKTNKIIALIAVTLLAVSFFCSLVAKKQAAKEELTVSAAISLREAFSEIGTVFEQAHPGLKLVFNYGASGQLAQQIQQGAPADVFASAAQDQMDKLVSANFVGSRSVHIFAKNHLVVVGQKGSKIASFTDLSKVERLAIGDPQAVPAGKYAKESLVKANLYSTFASQHKIVLAENVRQVLTYVESGNVDAGIVYSTDAAIGNGVVICFSVPDDYTQAIEYPIGMVTTTPHGKLAQEFIDAVIAPNGQNVLKQKGFLK